MSLRLVGSSLLLALGCATSQTLTPQVSVLITEHSSVVPWTNNFADRGLCRISFRDTAMYQEGEPISLAANKGTLWVIAAANGGYKEIAHGPPPFTITNLGIGYYFVESADDRAGFVVLPKGWQPAPWLGTELLGNVNWDLPISRVYTSLTVSIRREDAGVQWKTLQKVDTWSNPSTWDWHWVDEYIDHVGSNCSMLFCCNAAPLRYATNAAIFYRGWTNYVGAIMSRYKSLADQGRLYLEIWNEPWVLRSEALNFPFDRSGSSEQTYTNWMNAYADLVETTDVLRVTLHSNVKLVGPATVNLHTYYDLFRTLADRGDLSKLAALSFHDYSDESLPPDFPDFSWNLHPGQTQVSMIQTTRSIVGDIPFFVDEFGVQGRSAISDRIYTQGSAATENKGVNTGAMDWRTAQNRALKRILVYLANGTTLIIPHTGYRQPDDGSFESGLSLNGWERSFRGIKPKMAAILMLSWWTRGYMPKGLQITGKHCAVTFAGSTSRVFLWAKEGSTDTVTLPVQAILKDIYGNPVTPNNGVLTDEVVFYDLPP